MFDNILIVCTGNICRSPMAEFLLRHLLVDESVNISSAGMGALVAHPADANAIEVMDEYGVDISAHRARQLNVDLIKQNELVLVMEIWQLQELEKSHAFARGRVHLLGKWDNMEIPDPYKKSKADFIAVLEKIEMACKHWQEKIA